MKLTITALRTVTNQSEVTVKMPEGMDDAEFKSAIHFAEMNSSNLQDVALNVEYQGRSTAETV